MSAAYDKVKEAIDKAFAINKADAFVNAGDLQELLSEHDALLARVSEHKLEPDPENVPDQPPNEIDKKSKGK